jgi:hypothetical protein
MKLGQMVEITARVLKKRISGETVWERLELPSPVQGIYTGCRNVFDGKTEYEYADGGGYFTTFYQKKTHKVLVIVTNEHKNPVYVFPEDAQVIKSELEKLRADYHNAGKMRTLSQQKEIESQVLKIVLDTYDWVKTVDVP